MIRSVDWNGLKAVEFSKGNYTALLVPEVGANLISLRRTDLDAELLHCPTAEEVETFKGRPQIFGLPLLFPPNRIAGGRYTFEGRTYQYPITIPKENNYHHGILKSQPFVVSKAEERDEEVLIECRYYANAANDAIYKDFPHAFKCKVIYRLSDKGLEQEVCFFNKSGERMPIGVGFHTPLAIPFEGGTGAEYRLRMAVGEQVELSEKNLPTGRRMPLKEPFANLPTTGIQSTDCEPLEAAFMLREMELDGKPFRGAVVEHLTTGRKLCYEVDEKSIYWTLWNNGGQQPYCCPEPQSWVTNAPNAADPEAAGFCSIAPGEGWRAKYWIYLK